jgi:hypothetical protein
MEIDWEEFPKKKCDWCKKEYPEPQLIEFSDNIPDKICGSCAMKGFSQMNDYS